MKVAKELRVTANGVRGIAARGDLVLRQVKKKVRLCNEVSSDSLDKYKLLIARGLRRDPKKRRRSEGTGRKHKNKGYVLVHLPKHPRAMCDGYVFEQWLVMEEHLGRYLTKKETVHHINRKRDDNRIENLMLYGSRSEHMSKAHSELRSLMIKIQGDLNKEKQIINFIKELVK